MAAALAISGCLLAGPGCKPVDELLEPRMEAADDGNAKSTENPAIVFRKAFRRHPGEGDQILHAERREWSTSDGVSRWQWFIVVRPGPAMIDWLAGNPFGLAPPAGNPVNGGGGSPYWFPDPPKGRPVLRHPAEAFTLFHSRDGKTVYATDTGSGIAGTPGSSGS